MKVNYVTSLFPGASETFASNDAREMASRGIDLTIHSLRPAQAETEILVTQRGLGRVSRTYNGFAASLRGITMIVRRPRVALDLLTALFRYCSRTPLHLGKSLVLLPRALDIFSAVERQPPDVVHAHWSDYPAMVVYLVQRYVPGVVTSISFVAHDILASYGLSGPVAKQADFVRTLAQVNVQQVEERFGVPAERIEIVFDSVDLTLVPPATERVPRSVLTVGRLVEKKGTELVLQAFAKVRQAWQDASLRVLGAGPKLDELSRLATDLGIETAVTFVGHVPQDEVLREMRRAEVFLFLSESERLPNVVKEAMVCGCVCVASDTDGIDELIAHGTSGFVVPQRDIDGAAGYVDDIFAGRVATHEMTRSAEATIRDGFDLQVSVGRYQQRWTELVRAKRRDEVLGRRVTRGRANPAPASELPAGQEPRPSSPHGDH